MKLLAGNSNLPLARAIADYLELPLTQASVRRFADEEVFVEIHARSAVGVPVLPLGVAVEVDAIVAIRS